MITSAKKKSEKGQFLTGICLYLVANLQILQPYKKELEGICYAPTLCIRLPSVYLSLIPRPS